MGGYISLTYNVGRRSKTYQWLAAEISIDSNWVYSGGVTWQLGG
ncbi:hypothetical protein FM107_06085 [Sphingobacterium sp. JB170]|nr:hypothetical protein FM107_06085 [Sphingobacterium sp. JB170]